jgi:hypothetical protein
MVHIPESLLQLGGEGSEGELGLEIGDAVAPCPPPSQGTASEECAGILTSLYVIRESSGVHVLAHCEDKVGQLVGGSIKRSGFLDF